MVVPPTSGGGHGCSQPRPGAGIAGRVPGRLRGRPCTSMVFVERGPQPRSADATFELVDGVFRIGGVRFGHGRGGRVPALAPRDGLRARADPGADRAGDRLSAPRRGSPAAARPGERYAAAYAARPHPRSATGAPCPHTPPAPQRPAAEPSSPAGPHQPTPHAPCVGAPCTASPAPGSSDPHPGAHVGYVRTAPPSISPSTPHTFLLAMADETERRGWNLEGGAKSSHHYRSKWGHFRLAHSVRCISTNSVRTLRDALLQYRAVRAGTAPALRGQGGMP